MAAVESAIEEVDAAMDGYAARRKVSKSKVSRILSEPPHRARLCYHLGRTLCKQNITLLHVSNLEALLKVT